MRLKLLFTKMGKSGMREEKRAIRLAVHILQDLGFKWEENEGNIFKSVCFWVCECECVCVCVCVCVCTPVLERECVYVYVCEKESVCVLFIYTFTCPGKHI